MGLSPAGKLCKFGGQRPRNNAYGPKCGDNRRKYASAHATAGVHKLYVHYLGTQGVCIVRYMYVCAI